MDARLNRESAITNATEKPFERNRRLKVGGSIVLVVLLLALTTHSRENEPSAAPVVAAAEGPPTQKPSAFDYFPAQFGTPVPNGTPEEHIQAF